MYMRLREAFETQLTQKAMKRDNFCCQLCGSKKNLQVHHIVPFKKILSDIISEHPEYNIENNKEELYKIAVTDSRFLDLNNLMRGIYMISLIFCERRRLDDRKRIC